MASEWSLSESLKVYIKHESIKRYWGISRDEKLFIFYRNNSVERTINILKVKLNK